MSGVKAVRAAQPRAGGNDTIRPASAGACPSTPGATTRSRQRHSGRRHREGGRGGGGGARLGGELSEPQHTAHSALSPRPGASAGAVERLLVDGRQVEQQRDRPGQGHQQRRRGGHRVHPDEGLEHQRASDTAVHRAARLPVLPAHAPPAARAGAGPRPAGQAGRHAGAGAQGLLGAAVAGAGPAVPARRHARHRAAGHRAGRRRRGHRDGAVDRAPRLPGGHLRRLRLRGDRRGAPHGRTHLQPGQAAAAGPDHAGAVGHARAAQRAGRAAAVEHGRDLLPGDRQPGERGRLPPAVQVLDARRFGAEHAVLAQAAPHPDGPGLGAHVYAGGPLAVQVDLAERQLCKRPHIPFPAAIHDQRPSPEAGHQQGPVLPDDRHVPHGAGDADHPPAGEAGGRAPVVLVDPDNPVAVQQRLMMVVVVVEGEQRGRLVPGGRRPVRQISIEVADARGPPAAGAAAAAAGCIGPDGDEWHQPGAAARVAAGRKAPGAGSAPVAGEGRRGAAS
eukprot:scaffold25843_cov112-Isochrysis_galbana.AAC.3